MGLGSGLAMIILGTAHSRFAVIVGAALAGLTQASYMTLSASLIQKVVDDAYRGRVMSLYIMIAAGHMALMNLGFGRVAETIDVRVLLVGPGIAWTVFFAIAGLALPEVRSVVARGQFTHSLRPSATT